MRMIAAGLALLLAGCAAAPKETACFVPDPVKVPYEVKVPTYIQRTPPGELSRPYVPLDLPVFISPTDPNAKVGLDKDGIDRLKIILRTIKTRDDAWRAWAIPAAKAGSK